MALLDRGRIGGEASSAATGVFVPTASPDTAPDLLAFWTASNALYPDFVEELRAATGHALEFRIPGQLDIALTASDAEELRATYNHQAPAGIRATWLTGPEALTAEPLLAPEVQAAIFYPDHGIVDSPRLTQAVGAAFLAAGGIAYLNREVLGLTIEDDRVIGVTTPPGPIHAPVVVNCAGSWSGRIDPRATAPVRPFKGQVLAVDRGALPIHYLIRGRGGSLAPRANGQTIVAATVHDVGFDKDVIAGDIMSLFDRTCRLLPRLREARFLEAWAGLRPRTPDGRPIIGADPALAGLYWATGHFGMGLLSAPITARAVSDLIVRGTTPVDISGFGLERFGQRILAAAS